MTTAIKSRSRSSAGSLITDKLSAPLATRGHIDLLEEREDGQAHVRGWVFSEDLPIHQVEIRLNHVPWITACHLFERPDVQSHFCKLIAEPGNALLSGFDVSAPLPDEVKDIQRATISLIPHDQEGRPMRQLVTHFYNLESWSKTAPFPPRALQERIGGSDSFVEIGAQLTSLILTAAAPYVDNFSHCQILDWGCGCGRVLAQMRRVFAAEQLHGCDIDSEAIEWTESYLPGPHFCRIRPDPPTPYEDNSFDLIYGISVMTHLSEEMQKLWLQELGRIARPGALLVLSIIGEDLRARNMPAALTSSFEDTGFASFVPDYSQMLSRFSREGYYQESYHRSDYISGTWGSYFRVLEIIETRHQDLVVLQKPGTGLRQ